MNRVDEWDEAFEREHPLAWYALMGSLTLAVVILVVTALYLLVPAT